MSIIAFMKNHLKLSSKVFIFLAIVFLALFTYYGKPIFRPRIEQKLEQINFWEAGLKDGKMQALGYTLLEDDVQKAIRMQGNRFEFAVFEEVKGTQKNQQLELYFRETEVGRFTGRVIINLIVPAQEMQEILKNAGTAKRLPDSRVKYPILDTQFDKMNHLKIGHIAFIPTALSLDEATIMSKFGNPTKVLKEFSSEGEIMHYLYPQKGIDVALDAKKRVVIQYIVPAEFENKIVIPLTNATKK